MLILSDISRRMSKPIKLPVRPAKTRIRLGDAQPSLIRVFAVRMKKHWVLSYLCSAQRRLSSHWLDAQTDLSLRWAPQAILLFLLCCGSYLRYSGSKFPILLPAVTCNYLDRVKRIWYLSPMRAAKVQASLLAHTSSESRGTFRQKARSLAPLNGWPCVVEMYHDGMLEDTNSLDGAHLELTPQKA